MVNSDVFLIVLCLPHFNGTDVFLIPLGIIKQKVEKVNFPFQVPLPAFFKNMPKRNQISPPTPIT